MARAVTVIKTARRAGALASGAGPLAAAAGVAAVVVAVVLVGVAVLFSFAMGAPPSASAGCTPGAALAPATDLSPATVAAVEALRPTYEEAGAAAGLPWPLLAAVDYRENNNDPARSALSGEPIGAANPDNPAVTTTTKADSVARAAEHLKAMAASVYGVTLGATSPPADVQAGLLAYNRGSIYNDAGVGPEASPYVMNNLDGAHTDMVWPDIAGEPLAGRRELARYGAWTVFARLGGSASPGCGGFSANAVVAIAQAQLGLSEDPVGSNRGPGIAKFLGGGAVGGEAWCADFVSWVYASAGTPFSGGLDGGWRLPAVAGLQGWLMANGTWVDRSEAGFAGALDPVITARPVPQPGDVIVFVSAGDQDHAGVVEKVEGDVVQTIEGNTTDAVGRRQYPGYATNVQIVGWGRPR